LGIKPRKSFSTNSFCCGYARAISIVANKLGNSLELAAHEFILVVTASRISRITNYADSQSGPLFGDMATATLIAPMNSQHYPPKFEIIAAHVNKQSTSRPFFNFELQENGVQPERSGGKSASPNRVVFKLDGMAIADAAPRAMANAASNLANSVGLDPQDVQFIVPHQAGEAIVRFTEMKLRENGFSGEVINGLTRDVGNVSASSIPFAIKQNIDRLSGNIVCPAASVGQPGENHVMEGGILLRKVA
jgi:3-oxoacyl-[acyl-carrier-protein] synthase III